VVRGRPVPDPADAPPLGWQNAQPRYFETIGIPVLRGRAFEAADLRRTSHVTVINEAAARLLFGAEDPIGRHVSFGSFDPDAPDWHEIVGVVADVRHRGLAEPADARAYDLFGQHFSRRQTMVVETQGAPASVADRIRAIVAAADPEIPITRLQPLRAYVEEAVAPVTVSLALVCGLAGVALLLALVGVYAAASQLVSQKTREFALRAALGASEVTLARTTLAAGLKPALAGVVTGVLAAAWLGTAAARRLYGVGRLEPAILMVTAGVVAALALAACLAPARRAMRCDPVQLLRDGR